MATAVNVAIRLHLQDGATPALDKAARQAAERAEQAAKRTQRAVDKTEQDQLRSSARLRSAYEGVSRAREALGVRSELRIQREIASTEAAFARMSRAGFASELERQRALDATRAKVEALNREMGRVPPAPPTPPQAPARVGVRQGLAVGGAAVAAGAAGLAAVRGDFQHAMAVDDRLRDLANMAYRGRGIEVKRAGMGTMRDAVDQSVRAYGGKREGATEALSTLLENDVQINDAIKVLPSLMKFSKAGSVDPKLLAQIAMRAMQNFKIEATDMPNVLNMALAAGSAGGFELKDMAKWLPAQLGLAGAAGMSGKRDFAYLLSLNQAAVTTAGTKDEAGNNVVNLLGKIMSADTAKDVSKLGINHYDYLQKKRGEGMNSMEAFTALVDSTVAKRDDYRSIQAKLATTKDDSERRAMFESMASIAQSAGIGTLVQDRQALGALLASLNQRELIQRVQSEARANDVAKGGIGQEFYDFKAEGGATRAEKAQEMLQSAKDRALGDGGSWLGRFNDTVAEVSAKFPVLAGSTAVAATGVTAMAAAAGVATLALGRLGLAAGSGGGGGAGVLTKSKSLMGKVGPGLGLFLGGAAVAAAGGDDPNSFQGVTARYGSSALQFAGVGMLAGPVGAAVGAAIGLGFEGFKDAWRLAVTEPGEKAAKERKKLEMQASLKVEFADVNDRLVARIASQKIEARGGDVTLDAGSIWQGAPM